MELGAGQTVDLASYVDHIVQAAVVVLILSAADEVSRLELVGVLEEINAGGVRRGYLEFALGRPGDVFQRGFPPPAQTRT
jgi:hypothetical protein